MQRTKAARILGVMGALGATPVINNPYGSTPTTNQIARDQVADYWTKTSTETGTKTSLISKVSTALSDPKVKNTITDIKSVASSIFGSKPIPPAPQAKPQDNTLIIAGVILAGAILYKRKKGKR